MIGARPNDCTPVKVGILVCPSRQERSVGGGSKDGGMANTGTSDASGADPSESGWVQRWPRTIRKPPADVRVVYLDLNQWIMLSKAMAGHHDGARYQDALDICVSAVNGGSVVFPLSDSTYGEVAKIGQHRQRRALREVMETLSDYYVVMSRPDIAAHEVECLLDDVLGPSQSPVNTMDYLDRGVARAFGMVGGFRVYDESGTDTTEQLRAAYPDGPEAFDALVSATELMLQRSVLDGPATAEEETELRKRGWKPGGASHVAEKRMLQEVEQAARFSTSDLRWRKDRIRDVITLRELLIELDDTLSRGLADRGADLGDLGSTIEDRRDMFDSLPSLDVAVTIKASYHRNLSHRWTVNDIYDIDAMGSTVPYCDIVVTDRAVASHIRRAHLDLRLGTRVLSNLDELAALIQS